MANKTERQRDGETERDSQQLLSPSPHLPISPSSAHTIRLRGPWDCQPLARAGDLSALLRPGGTIAMPGDWGGLLGADFRGTVRFTRRFNRPTGLESGERVLLVIEDADPQTRVTLNGVPLEPIRSPGDSDTSQRYEITSNLCPRNDLHIEITTPADAPQPGRLGLVTLEIG